MIKRMKPSVATPTTFSVKKKKNIDFNPNNSDKRCIRYFSEVLTEHFSMSEELAKAIGTVVVQALTENAKDEEKLDDGLDLELDEDDDLDFGESELPESARDKGEAEESEGPKNAPDLSSDFAEMKKTINNHSVTNFAQKRYEQVKEFFDMNN